MYKVGQWLKCKQTGELAEICDVYQDSSGYSIYTLLSYEYDGVYGDFYEHEITELFDLCRMAQILYGNKASGGKHE